MVTDPLGDGPRLAAERALDIGGEPAGPARANEAVQAGHRGDGDVVGAVLTQGALELLRADVDEADRAAERVREDLGDLVVVDAGREVDRRRT